MIVPVQTSEGTRLKVYLNHGGKRTYVGTYSTPKEAKAAEQDAASRQRAIERGELPAEIDDKRTLKTAAEDWLTALDKGKSRSADSYRQRTERWILPHLG